MPAVTRVSTTVHVMLFAMTNPTDIGVNVLEATLIAVPTVVYLAVFVSHRKRQLLHHVSHYFKEPLTNTDRIKGDCR